MYWCNKCGAVVSIGGKRDIVPCCKCGSENYTGSPQNLAQPDAYSVLAEVRADIKELLNSIDDLKKMKDILIECGVFVDKSAAVLCINEVEKKADKVSEHFS